MPQAGRVGDNAQREHATKSKAHEGSPDVLINGRAALRVGDPGEHDSWKGKEGSTGVTINGVPALRYGDETKHSGDTKGELVEGSPDVFLGEHGSGTPKEKPHDTSVAIAVTDGLGRPVHDVTVTPFCPHTAHDPTTDVAGGATVGGLCSGATVAVHKTLQVGGFDAGATVRSAHLHQKHTAAPVASAASAPGGNGSGNGTGGAAYVHSPAPAATGTSPQAVHFARPNGQKTIVLPTVHNWVDLIFHAFGHQLPTGKDEVALLGVREASLSGVAPGQTTDQLEGEAAAGDLAHVDFTREPRGPAYNDLLFCVWTDKNVNSRQNVEVFECTIDSSPGPGQLHVPVLLEGRFLHGKPGSYKKYPGTNVALHLFSGNAAPAGKGSAAEVMAIAHSQLEIVESPPGSNMQKYGAWYGTNGVYWCAQFVSWCMHQAGIDLIHYEYCPTGANMFKSGAWGTWHTRNEKAEPGDVVFYEWKMDGVYDHTGIVLADNGGTVTTIEGNTSPEGSGGSDPNGGGVHQRHRYKNGTLGGFGRPRYAAQQDGPESVIRFGKEQFQLDPKADNGSTILHHHYFTKDAHGKNVPDPAATRYRRFMHIYNGAANKDHIPYVIASSQYLVTYPEWVKWVTAHPGEKPPPRTVILPSGLRHPTGLPGKYLPSFLTTQYADRVLKEVHDMKDRHQAAKLRAELEAALFQLSI